MAACGSGQIVVYFCVNQTAQSSLHLGVCRRLQVMRWCVRIHAADTGLGRRPVCFTLSLVLRQLSRLMAVVVMTG